MMSYKLLGLVSLFLTLSVQGQNIMPNRSAAVISSYMKEFNAADVELYAQDISNAETFDFLNENIPFFECPDKELEKSYYFRWWTYRKLTGCSMGRKTQYDKLRSRTSFL